MEKTEQVQIFAFYCFLDVEFLLLAFRFPFLDLLLQRGETHCRT